MTILFTAWSPGSLAWQLQPSKADFHLPAKPITSLGLKGRYTHLSYHLGPVFLGDESWIVQTKCKEKRTHLKYFLQTDFIVSWCTKGAVLVEWNSCMFLVQGMALSCLIMCCLSWFLEAKLMFFSPSLFLHPGLYPVSAQVDITYRARQSASSR